jgi:hypothetical protein
MEGNIQLTAIQEYRLKKQLVEFILEEEFETLQNKNIKLSACMQELPLTGFCFTKFVKGIPLIKKDQSLWIKVDELISSIKALRLSSAAERGKKDTKTMKTVERFKIMCTLFFTRTLQTPVSRQHRTEEELWLRQETAELEAELAGIEEIKKETVEYKEIQEENRILNEWTRRINGEPDGRTVKELFHWTKQNGKIAEMPQLYRPLFASLSSIWAFRMYVAFHIAPDREEHLSSLKLMYNLTPFNILRGIIKLTNPSKIIKHVISFFLSKPFGAKSILQRVIEKAAADEEDEEEDIAHMDESILTKKDLHKLIGNKHFVEKINNFVHQKELPPPLGIAPVDRVLQVLSDKSVEPQLSPSEVQHLSDAQINAMYQLLIREIRARDLIQISAFLGQDNIIQTIEVVLEAIYSPLFNVCQQANLEDFLKYFSSFLHDIKKIAQSKKQPKEQLISAYKRATDEFISQMFLSLHALLTVDDGTVESLFYWFMDNYYPVQTFDIDLDRLASLCLTPHQRASLMFEITELIKYKNWKREEKAVLLPGMAAMLAPQKGTQMAPELKTMRMLAKPFLAHTVAVMGESLPY